MSRVPRLHPRSLWVVLLAACASVPQPPPLGEQTLSWAQALLAQGRARPVVSELERLSYSRPDEPYAAEALYLLGKAHMALKEYVLAQEAFRTLVETYPKSPWTDDAELGIALCAAAMSPRYALDQTSTLAAERQLQQFVEDYPTSPLVPQALEELARVRDRLALKLFSSAQFYFRRGRFQAAQIYAEELLRKYPSATVVPKTRLLLASCLERKGEYAASSQLLLQLLDQLDPNDPLRPEVARLLAKVRRKLER